EQHALPTDRQRLVDALEHSSTVRRAHLPDLRAKNSRSTVSLSDLGVQLLDLAFARFLRSRARHPRQKPGRLVQQLLLPSIDLVR
ncbi:hypothetical protein, partial [Bradyrhizobium japonicum]